MSLHRSKAPDDLYKQYGLRQYRQHKSTTARVPAVAILEPPQTDTFYQLTPKAVRWYKLRKKQEAFCIMAHEERELMIYEAKHELDPFPDGPVNECNRRFIPQMELKG